MIDENPIPQLVARHRVLTRQKKAIEAEIAEVRAGLKPLIETHGKYVDADGYARITKRGPSVSFNAKAVDNIALSWCKSTDAIMQSCGEMLMTYRSQRDGSESLQVK